MSVTAYVMAAVCFLTGFSGLIVAVHGQCCSLQHPHGLFAVFLRSAGFFHRSLKTKALARKPSEIARLITGARWSGPLFFGLKAKSSKESKEAQ